MSRALLNLWNAKITGDLKPGWATTNAARQIRFPVMVTVKRKSKDGVRYNLLFYQVSAYGQAAEFLIQGFESGMLKVGDRINLMCRVESNQIYKNHEGKLTMSTNVTALENEPIWTMRDEHDDPEEDDEVPEA
jgi:hypothetical protein